MFRDHQNPLATHGQLFPSCQAPHLLSAAAPRFAAKKVSTGHSSIPQHGTGDARACLITLPHHSWGSSEPVLYWLWRRCGRLVIKKMKATGLRELQETGR